MKIKKMTATFGGLDNAVLEPGAGLTVITAPNEAGKSTWAGFLKTMLYGIDTRERDKTGFLADKTRYQPWSGAPMSGELQIEWQGKDVTLRRFPTRTNPFGGFEAVYTASGDPVPGLTAANVGEQLTGVGKEVYLRSAFVGQGGAAIASSKELESRVSALATSGQEDISYTAVERTLKDWRNRRRSNRSNGLIPQLEEEKSSLDGTLREMDQTRRLRSEAEQELARLQERQKELQSDLEIWTRLERHDLNRRYAEAYMEWEKGKAAIPEDKPHPIFGSMTGEEARAFAQKKQEELDTALEENREKEAMRTGMENLRVKIWKATVYCCTVMMILLLVSVAAYHHWPWLSILCVIGAAISLLVLLMVRLVWHAIRQGMDDSPLIPVPEWEDWRTLAAEYREALAQAQQAKAVEAAARRRVDDLAAQGGQMWDTLELLHKPEQSKEDVTRKLNTVNSRLSQMQNELARTEGMLAHMGGPEDVEDRRNELDAQLTQRLEEYDALTIALDALDAANDALRQRFSPALNQKAGELFAALTGGRWPRLTLARDFSAQTGGTDDPLPRSSLALSTGTAEQLYLAVRLALCALTVPDAPLVLDDALTAFDDERMTLALELLSDQAQERQILLFSCHSREADWARTHNMSVIKL